MSNVIQFPSKAQYQKGSPEDFRPYLVHLGATEEEIPILLDRLGHHFDLVEQSFDLTIPHTFPAPLTDEQLEAINAALRAQAAAVSSRLKENNARTLLEFAKLEYQLLRAR